MNLVSKVRGSKSGRDTFKLLPELLHHENTRQNESILQPNSGHADVIPPPRGGSAIRLFRPRWWRVRIGRTATLRRWCAPPKRPPRHPQCRRLHHPSTRRRYLCVAGSFRASPCRHDISVPVGESRSADRSCGNMATGDEPFAVGSIGSSTGAVSQRFEP